MCTERLTNTQVDQRLTVPPPSSLSGTTKSLACLQCSPTSPLSFVAGFYPFVTSGRDGSDHCENSGSQKCLVVSSGATNTSHRSLDCVDREKKNLSWLEGTQKQRMADSSESTKPRPRASLQSTSLKILRRSHRDLFLQSPGRVGFLVEWEKESLSSDNPTHPRTGGRVVAQLGPTYDLAIRLLLPRQKRVNTCFVISAQYRWFPRSHPLI